MGRPQAPRVLDLLTALERVRAVARPLLVVAFVAFDGRAGERLFGAGAELDVLGRRGADEDGVLATDDRLHAFELVDVVEDLVDGRVALLASVARHAIEDVVDAGRQ